MSVKDFVLEVLEEKRGRFVSGGELASRLSVSRNAVWKAVQALNEEGLNIKAVTNKGYMLDAGTDKISRQGIGKYVDGKGLDFKVYDTLDSTNNTAKTLAAQGAAEGTVVVAKTQSAGRGRTGRSFYSSDGCGVYLSIILRPKNSFQQALFLTVTAAVATAEAIEKAGGKKVQIKWVNDLYTDGKKCCGILSEAALDMESGGVEYVIVGIGVNVREPLGGYPKELKGIAGCVFDDEIDDVRNKLIAYTAQEFMALYNSSDKQTVYEEYKRRSMVIGKKISVVKNNSCENALALDIDDECRLKVRYDDGREDLLSSGEVRVKPAIDGAPL